MEHRPRLLIVDDQRIFAEGLKYVIESRAKDFEAPDIAANGQEALEMLKKMQPDIILMDVHMPVMNGVEATRIIHQMYPAIKILVLTTFDDDEYVRHSIEYGAVGYLLKNRSPDDIIDSLRALQNGIMQIDPAISAKLFRSAVKNPAAEGIAEYLQTLTDRERQVLRLLVEATKITRIAEKLGIAEQTVRNHISNIYFKLGIHNHMEIVRYIHQIKHFLENEGL